MNELEIKVLVYCDNGPLTEMWDGKEYELGGDPITIERGIAEHWQNRHPEAQIRIENMAAEQLDIRTPQNPLEANDRGEAFAGLKRTGRKRASGE